jgi:hypothetical protein
MTTNTHDRETTPSKPKPETESKSAAALKTRKT